jgi:transcriptional regulator with XRE-family HTH domain
MAKAFPDEVNDLLRDLMQSVVEDCFDGKQAAFAAAVGLSDPYVSDILRAKRGGGLELLIAIARYRPLELLPILKIDPRTVSILWNEQRGEGVEMGELPNELKRAARAAVELFGCTPAVALRAANGAFAKHGETPHADPDWWLGKMRGDIEEFRKSGERPSIRLLKSPKD